MSDTPPFYRDPRGIRVLSEVTTLAIADFTFVGSLNPLPVYADTPVPGAAMDTPAIYRNPAGALVPSEVFTIILSDGTMVGPGNPLPVTGGGGGPISADMVTYTNPAVPDVENVAEALDFLIEGGGGTNWPGVMARISVGV